MLFVNASNSDKLKEVQKESLKKFIRHLENNQIRISKNTLFCLGNRDKTISQDIYRGLVDAFGEDIVRETMMEVFGEQETLIRLDTEFKVR